MNESTIDDLIGKTFTKVKNVNNQELVFVGEKSYQFWHQPDCCESVEIDDILR